MSIVEEEVQATVAKPQATLAKVDDGEFPEVQKLALTGYDFDNVLHLVLRIRSTDKARQWLSDLLSSDLLTFSDRLRGQNYAINIGFTYRGLKKLGLPERFSQELARKAPAFYEGAPSRAAAVGDGGESAAERWDPPFRFENADVLICIYGSSSDVVQRRVPELMRLSAAREGFDGWDWDWMQGEHLTHDPENRRVHFGFRDSVSQPVVECSLLKDGKPRHSVGELLLGYRNDANFNHWAANKVTPKEVADFFRNGTFGILRKIEQHEDRFEGFLEEKARELLARSVEGLPENKGQLVQYLKAKLCGRWPNGVRMRPGQTIEPYLPEKELKEELKKDRGFDFTDDKDAEGCPFGAHIRRGSPRRDKVLPERRRVLFRRGVPYTNRTDSADGTARVERGLLGLFFCASIEDQFEHLLSEWIEKMPMGPPSLGNAKDPIVGQHDGSKTSFHIPGNAGGLRLDGFDEPFVTTRGTLYALFPSQRALSEIAAFVESP